MLLTAEVLNNTSFFLFAFKISWKKKTNPKSLSFPVLCLLVISLIETDGTYVSFWAEKPPNLLRLQLDAMLRFNFLGALTDAEITGCRGAEFRGKKK